MLLRNLVLVGVFSFAGFGCASRHASMRGSIVMKVSATDAHVCLGKGDVALNDRVELYKKVCDTTGKRPVCHQQAMGEGVVTQLLNDHYSVVEFPAGVAFEETGYTVEPIR